MPGVPRRLAEHTLNVDPKYKLVKQFLRRFNEERRKAIGEEVARLLAAGFIIEVFHLMLAQHQMFFIWEIFENLLNSPMAFGVIFSPFQNLLLP